MAVIVASHQDFKGTQVLQLALLFAVEIRGEPLQKRFKVSEVAARPGTVSL